MMKDVALPVLPETKKHRGPIRPYGFEETTHRKRFDDLTQLARTICRVPMAFIIVEELGRWQMRSQVGLGGQPVADLIPLCREAASQSNLTLVTAANETDHDRLSLLPESLE